MAEEDILGDLKKKKGGAAAGGSTYQFNQRAYKKYLRRGPIIGNKKYQFVFI